MIEIKNIDFERLDAKIFEYCEKERISGVLRIAKGERILLKKSIGYACIEENRPFTEHSMFTFYSLSKPFCAIGLLLLKDRGLVDLDCHPSVYIPEAKNFDTRVTVRHMLHHVSGLPDFEQKSDFARAHRPGTPARIRAQLPLLAKETQYFAPGTDAIYTNVNFVLCALIIENLSGLPYGEYMKRYVFSPLGMHNATVDQKDLRIPERVQGYDLVNGEVTPIEKSYDWLLGAGDIVGTVDDAFVLRRVLRDKLLLSEETHAEMLAPNPISGFGMGCTVSLWHGKKAITHTGGHLGFRALHKYLPEEDLDIIFLSNSGYGAAREALSEIIHAAFFGESAPEKQPDMDKGYI